MKVKCLTVHFCMLTIRNTEAEMVSELEDSHLKNW